MLLAQATFTFDNKVGKMDKDTGRKIGKALARDLDEYFRKSMISFYPTHIKSKSIDMIVEFIGSDTLLHSGGIDWKYFKERVEKAITSTDDEISISSVDIKEISFCQASSSMLYCYKQDGFLLPDSDPHDVMGLECRYNDVPLLYKGRFTPYIKLWCDCVQPSNMILTGGVIDDDDKCSYSEAQVCEYDAFDKEKIDAEVEYFHKLRETRKNKPFTPFNKYYKGMVTNRTMIPMIVNKIIPELKKTNMLISDTYMVTDLVDLLYVAIDSGRGSSSLIDKWATLMQELKGTTLVVFADIPNHFLSTEAGKDKECQNLQIEKTDSNEGAEVDNIFRRNMESYNLLDIDDSLDFTDRVSVVRKVIRTVTESRKADGHVEVLDKFNVILTRLVRDMNLIVLYTDTKAYDTDFLLELGTNALKKMSVKQVSLSDVRMDESQLTALGMASIHNYYGCIGHYRRLQGDSHISDYITKRLAKYIDSKTATDMEFKSTYEFRYRIAGLLEYSWTRDVDGDAYFSDLRKASNKKAETDNAKKNDVDQNEEIDDEDEEDDIIDSSRLMDEDDDLRSSGFSSGGYGAHRNSGENGETDAEIELDKMIGLTSIKEQIKDFAAFVKLDEMKKEKNFGSVPISKHMIFTGNPGTAKTTVARQLAKILHAKGLLPTANLIQVSRDDLVGKYVGWTARLTAEAIKKAKGGILFVDEAYSLTQNEGGSNSYGSECIDTFVNYMDKPDVRDTTIIIFAGYKKPMEEFINSNPGLKSRVGFYFDFPDYSTDELLEIAKVQAKHVGYSLTPGYIKSLKNAINKERGAKDFGNGRFVRGVFEKSILKQSRRLANNPKLKFMTKKEDFCTLIQKDFSVKGMTDKTKDKGVVGFKA